MRIETITKRYVEKDRIYETERAKIEFAPDGKSWQTIKRAKHTMSLWDYFCRSLEIRQQAADNPYAKFRLIGTSGIVVATLPR